MHIQTLSILAGTAACNARCQFCVSKMTVPNGITLKPQTINWSRFKKAVHLAEISGCTTAMITGKGEPTLFPDEVTNYLLALEDRIPIIELQTNATRLTRTSPRSREFLDAWLKLGLNTIAISIVSTVPEENRLTYLPYEKSYIDLPDTIAYIKSIGFSVRLSVVAVKGYIDTPEALSGMINYARSMGVEQLSVRPVTNPSKSDSRSAETYTFIEQNCLSAAGINKMQQYLDSAGTVLMRMAYGAIIYDVSGQNIAWTNCLTESDDPDDIRQLIFYPDGHVRYSWTKAGAILF